MKDSRTKEDIYRKFQNPAREYRGTPFWSWNAEMTPEEVRRQVRELYEQGVGGFFIHSRGWRLPILAGNGWTVWKQRWMKQNSLVYRPGYMMMTAGHQGMPEEWWQPEEMPIA